MVEVDEKNLKHGLLGLVVGLVEIIQEVLEREAIRRIESGRLSDEEIERLGSALMDMKNTLGKIKEENDLTDIVEKFRRGLDNVADEAISKLVDPYGWKEKYV
jgi:uncharacterized protein YjgD (DUF1641 family)